MSQLSDLEATLGIKFKNITILQEALTHRSYLNEDPSVKSSNERLEFLGDSVLSVLTSTELFKRFPNYPEGDLTSLRSAAVRTQTLGKLALSLKFGEFLRLSHGEERGGGRKNLSLLADTFEAVLGAIYLDAGLTSAQKFLDKHLFPQIDYLLTDPSVMDYKSRLQEIIQEKKKVAPVYRVVKEEGPDHSKTFTVAVFAGSQKLGQAGGKSKQEAEQEAARIALADL